METVTDTINKIKNDTLKMFTYLSPSYRYWEYVMKKLSNYHPFTICTLGILTDARTEAYLIIYMNDKHNK